MSDLEMILKMSLATLMYVIITGGLWIFCRKNDRAGRIGWKVLAGLVFGACSVAANHIGIEYNAMVLNVRDIGPLSAGLLFSPLSGIIAGVIGGAERILAGELWGIGTFTEIACGVSTALAGILAAALNRLLYKEKRPTVLAAFMLGAVMEVFHMYAVLFTNRDDMMMAYEVVKIAAVPMITFTAIGTALCCAAVMKLSGQGVRLFRRIPEEQTPTVVHFQRWMLLVTLLVFLFNFVVSYLFQTRLALDNAEMEMYVAAYQLKAAYEETGDIQAVKKEADALIYGNFLTLLIDAETGKTLGDEPLLLGEYLTPEEFEEIKAHAGTGQTFFMNHKETGFELMCRALQFGDTYVFIYRMTTGIYDNRDSQVYENTLSDILLFTVLYLLTAMLVEKLVVRHLQRVNKSLRRITEGHLDEVVWVRPSSEFAELSDDINKTVKALRGYISAAEKRMQEELKMAATIQDAALPKNFRLPTDRVELYALMTPARQVGGDFYDFFYIGLNELCLVIADVSGKGVPASLFMMRAKTAIKNNARSGNSPAELLANVNNTLCEGNDAEMFVTVWIGILNLDTGILRCSNAGHEYPVLMRAGGDYELYKDSHGLVLAAMEGVRMREYEIQLDPGDRLLVYTDGVPEAINEKEEAYGAERLVTRLNELKRTPQQRTLEGVLQDIRNFAGGAEQFDDITMLGITYCPAGVPEKE